LGGGNKKSKSVPVDFRKSKSNTMGRGGKNQKQDKGSHAPIGKNAHTKCKQSGKGKEVTATRKTIDIIYDAPAGVGQGRGWYHSLPGKKVPLSMGDSKKTNWRRKKKKKKVALQWETGSMRKKRKYKKS